MRTKIIFLFFKVSVFVLIVLSTISPKAFKILTGFEGVYPNPHLFLAIIYIPLFVVLGFAKINNHTINSIFFGLLLSLIYWLSAFLTYVSHYSDINSILQSIRYTLTYLFLIPLFFSIKSKYIYVIVKLFILNALIYIPIFLYGLGVFFNLIPSINDNLKRLIYEDILSMSWTALGFIPKWRVVFEETQVMATFYLISAILAYKVNMKVYFLIFSIFSVYLFSKSALIGLFLYLSYIFIYKRLKARVSKLFVIYTAIVVSILSLYKFYSIEKQLFTNIYEAGIENAASFGERIFHIYQTFLFMSENIYTFFIGLGPRVYGSLVSQLYPWRFNIDSNAISFFTVFQDIGIIGFGSTIIYIYYVLWRKIKDTDIRIGFIAVLVAYMLQVSWGHSVILIGLTLLVRISWRKYENIH